ncbi:heme lyase CcmF/NrfE family subunit [Saccharibacter sp. 17.LH.SD]|uniref:heme lyase CcmF/NrfE family subunit n=1 Tax=Saccharibacter sp. 17.LH.SD TaxID=2689393 RepID=UPI00136DD117|nr:heme lyase CcmF/NrfE family subunit [Saccharibacter sp. 17.LH.SD]MXV43951.1 heme lyase CcmF/NrfE family subunit [Saccharibacter sp. 17.LH.SD]
MMELFGPEEGHYALALGCVLALFQGTLPFLGKCRSLRSLATLAVPLAISQCGALLLSFICLILAAVRDDFSVKNIAENSALNKPMLYKIAGVWGNHEGSILLWIVILSLCGAAVACSGHHKTGLTSLFRAYVLAILGLISGGFQLFCLLTSNPFTRLIPMPADGLGMNPLLQDPGLAFHPPILYAGYVGFAVPFAFAVAALISGNVNSLWGRWVRPWTVAAWALLTCGITLGSWWSYYVLGWGGYWFWDPVENASLIPWLSGTALLHSAIVTEKRNGLKIWTVFLAIASFSFSLSGTFLVRSGILNSVHAFANDPARGIFILSLLGLISGGALFLFAWRAPTLNNGPLFSPVSRENALVFNNILLCSLCAVVLTGTLYPPFMQLLFGRTLSVGKPFFDSTTIPLVLPLLFGMGIGTSLSWRHASLGRTFKRLRPAFFLTLITAIPLYWNFRNILAFSAACLALWVITSSITDVVMRLRAVHTLRHLPRGIWGACLAHIGVGVTILGICGMDTAQHAIVASHIGEHHQLEGNDWLLTSVRSLNGPNYQALQADILVSHQGKEVATLHPSLRTFITPHQSTSEVAIHSSIRGDLYAVFGGVQHTNPETYILRLHDNPLAPWIWIGGLIMALGGLLSLPYHRFRYSKQNNLQKTHRTAVSRDHTPCL